MNDHVVDFGNCKCGVKAIARMGKADDPNPPAFCGMCLENAGGPLFDPNGIYTVRDEAGAIIARVKPAKENA